MHWNIIFLGLTLLSIVLSFAPSIVKSLGIDMAPTFVYGLCFLGIVGLAVGTFLLVWGFFPDIIKYPIVFVGSFALVGAVLFGSGAWVYLRYVRVAKPLAEALSPEREGSNKDADIAWKFDTDPGSYFLGMVGGQGQESWVDSFQAHGRNNLDEPISRVSGFVRSDITNAEFPIRFVIGGQRVLPKNTNGIPRKADFVVASEPFPSSDPSRRATGLTASRFLVDFATFTFVFEYNGKKFTRHFSNEEVWNQIVRFQRATQTAVPSVMQRQPPSESQGR